ncbi:MAG: LytTR family DNA-binding domain-containing protein [Bacteroidales bacterium]|nr:LytTR family DNA-binding domain-containing protein [Bacteroidales bacterium]
MDYLKIPTSNELLRVRLSDIVCIEADGNYSKLTFASGWSHTLTLQLHRFAETFKAAGITDFVRVGRSLIVNQQFVSMINLTERRLVLQGGAMAQVLRLTASRDALAELKQIMEGGQYGD